MASSSSTSSLLRKQAVAPVLNVCVWCARLWLGIRKRVGPGTVVFRAPPFEGCCGGVLLSHTLPGAVPSALAGLASRFGMEAGRFPGAMTTTRFGVQHCSPHGVWGCGLIVVCIVVAAVLQSVFSPNFVGLLFSVGPLVPVGSRAHCCASTSGLSTR